MDKNRALGKGGSISTKKLDLTEAVLNYVLRESV